MPEWVSSSVHKSVVAARVEARHANGMTQRDLAAILGKPPSFVGKVEAIERNLSVLEFLAWTSALGIKPGELFENLPGTSNS